MPFVSEPILPDPQSFDPVRMARGEPGLPKKFFWRDKEFSIIEALEQWKEYGDCKHGSGEQYLRKHRFRLRTTEGLLIHIYFQRSFGRAKKATGSKTSRWWLHSIETT